MAVAKVLVVGGGGGGGQVGGGGGGAGGYQYDAAFVVTPQAYTVTVGAGGSAAGNGAGNQTVQGGDGGNSVFSTITATGGGGGAAYDTNPGRDGGSGGGGGATSTGSSGSGGTGSQGNNGGSSNAAINGNGGGGGGATAVGANAISTKGGNGGAGTANSITGASVTYSGGGGGGSVNNATSASSGGAGGGGAGGFEGNGVAGTANTGGGGGGGGFLGGTYYGGGAGGSGVVIISYVTADFVALGWTVTGGVITADGANTVHTFNSNGTFTIAVDTLDVNDKTANGNNLTNNGAANETSSLPFAQSTSAAILAATQYLTAEDSASLSITGDMTVEFYVMVTTQPGTGVSYDIINKHNTTGNNRSWRLSYADTAGTKQIHIALDQTGDTSTRDRIHWDYTLTTDTWIHVALTITPGNATATECELFINGVSQGNGTVDEAGNISAIFNSTAKVRIGNIDGGNGGDFTGKIDDIRIWNDIRTGTEIANNRNVELAGNEANLVAYWPFESLTVVVSVVNFSYSFFM